MRLTILAPLLLLAACQVERDPANDTTTLEFNEAVAANAVDDVANTAENVGAAIANDVERSADKVKNEVGDVDVDVDVSRNGSANAH